MEKNSDSAGADTSGTMEMFDIVCSVDHSTYGEPAGQVLARVRELGDSLAEFGASHPNCRLTAVPVDAAIGSQFGEPPAAESESPRRSANPSFEQPIRPVQPVYPLAR